MTQPRLHISSFPPIRLDGVGWVAAPAARRDTVEVSKPELHVHIAIWAGELWEIHPRQKSGEGAYSASWTEVSGSEHTGASHKPWTSGSPYMTMNYAGEVVLMSKPEARWPVIRCRVAWRLLMLLNPGVEQPHSAWTSPGRCEKCMRPADLVVARMNPGPITKPHTWKVHGEKGSVSEEAAVVRGARTLSLSAQHACARRLRRCCKVSKVHRLQAQGVSSTRRRAERARKPSACGSRVRVTTSRRC
jgi:hypothetical protein